MRQSTPRDNKQDKKKKEKIMTSARIEPRPFVKAHSDLVLTFPLSTSRHSGRAHELLRETMRLFFILLALAVMAM